MIEVKEVTTKAERKAFIELPYAINYGHPQWTPPLRMVEAERFDPKKNPALKEFDLAYWLAWHDGRPVGRIASFINRAHLDRYKDGTGHFGFLDVMLHPPGVQAALLATAGDWLKAKGMAHIAGPFNFSVNEECGMLVEGFDTKQMFLMPHGRPDYPAQMEKAGFEKAMDTLAFLNHAHNGYPRPKVVERMIDYVDKSDKVRVRPMNKGAFKREVALAMDIFNDAWADNWGFVPFSDAEVQHMASQLQLIIDPDGFWFGEVDGEAVGFVMLAPNLNEAIEGLDGRLFPFGWAKLLYRLKVKGLATGRVPLNGIRKSVQKTRNGGALMLGLFEAAFDAMRRKGLQDIELSWVLEENTAVQEFIALSGAEVYKRYRIYKKAL